MSDKPTTLEDALVAIEVLESKLKEVRAEAAKRRVENKDAVAAAKSEAAVEFEAKLEELRKEAAGATDQVNQSNIVVAKLMAALGTLPSDSASRVTDMAGRLIGNSQDELVEDAKRLQALYGVGTVQNPPATDPSQGTGNNEHMALNGDPLLRALEGALGQKPRR